MYVDGSNDFSYTTVDPKFMLSGHSYLPNDRDFRAIEKVSRRTQHVFVPEDSCVLVEGARQRNPLKSNECQPVILSPLRMFVH